MTRLCLSLSFIFFLFSGIVYSASFDPADIIFHYHGTDTNSYAGNRISTIGDVNGDGFSDIAISSFHPESTFVFFGGDPADSIADMWLCGHIAPARAIDLTGDGINEVITANDKYMYFYRGYGDSLGSVAYDSLGFVPYLDGAYSNIETAYFDSDLIGDILTFLHNTVGGPTLLYYSSIPSLDQIADWSFKINNLSHYFTDFGFIDFNGDEQLDIFLGLQADLDTLSFVYIFYGPSPSDFPDLVIGHPAVDLDSTVYLIERFAKQVANVGDIDGDGWSDLSVTWNNQPFVYKGGPSPDTVYDYMLGGYANFLTGVGDVDCDGFDDLVGGGSRTADGVVDLYLGGISFDSIFDLSIYRPNLPPLFLDDIGYRISPAGDFNGDGCDDFMFSCRNFSLTNPGDVFMVQGSSYLVTAVNDGKENLLPTDFVLYQNYPNPFNPTTTIAFELPEKSEVNLTVYNILGRDVRLLLSQPLSAGSHSIEWNGRDNNDQPVASGVYFYKLTTDIFTQSRKMLLLK